MASETPSGFEKLLAKNVTHIHEMILLSVDYKTFKNLSGVCKIWDELLASESFQMKAKELNFSRILERLKDRLKDKLYA